MTILVTGVAGFISFSLAARLTMADVSRLERITGYRPATTVEEGVRRFVDWYRNFCSLTP